jgi:hypothetical protein
VDGNQTGSAEDRKFSYKKVAEIRQKPLACRLLSGKVTLSTMKPIQSLIVGSFIMLVIATAAYAQRGPRVVVVAPPPPIVVEEVSPR